jgi:hypothetical protein
LGLILPFALDASITGLTAESWQTVELVGQIVKRLMVSTRRAIG